MSMAAAADEIALTSLGTDRGGGSEIGVASVFQSTLHPRFRTSRVESQLIEGGEIAPRETWDGSDGANKKVARKADWEQSQSRAGIRERGQIDQPFPWRRRPR